MSLADIQEALDAMTAPAWSLRTFYRRTGRTAHDRALWRGVFIRWLAGRAI
jgi:hypothetical protein